MVAKTRISVAMAVYNGSAYLAEQLDSVLAQLSPEDEVVISDDGSLDGTEKLLGEYQKKDCRIRIVGGPGRGVKKNVEHALLCCRGAYIFLADQDDIWLPDKVDKVMHVFTSKGCPLVIHDASVFEGADREHIRMESFFAFRHAGPGIAKNIIRNSYIGCCMAFRAELKPKLIPIPDDIEMHDQWIGVLSEYYGGKPVFLREPLLLYRRHGQNQSGMSHYGIGKMIRNRVVFLYRFCKRVRHISQKKE